MDLDIHDNDSEQNNTLKRKRNPEPSHDHQDGTAASSDDQSRKRHRQPPDPVPINYFARQPEHSLPLISTTDSFAEAFSTLNRYFETLDRSESLASNLGARPLSNVLIDSFERVFSGQPRTLHTPKSKDARESNVSWLDVVGFADEHPDQFVLIQTEDGSRVCQFTTHQCKVEILEHDWRLLKCGVPQKLIPPQPIAEDEEKELVTLDILERSVKEVTKLADQIAARARQFSFGMQGRRRAILERRASNAAVNGTSLMESATNSNINHEHSNQDTAQQQAAEETTHEGLTNGHNLDDPSTRAENGTGPATSPETSQIPMSQLTPEPSTSSQPTRDTLFQNFTTLAERRLQMIGPTTSPHPFQSDTQNGLHPDLIRPNTSGKHPKRANGTSPTSNTSNSTPKDPTASPFRAAILARLETLPRGHRIYPPCDRCRRLKMDCVKNLTACTGCTKKHAKCAWKGVSEDEVRGFRDVVVAKEVQEGFGSGVGAGVGERHYGVRGAPQGPAMELDAAMRAAPQAMMRDHEHGSQHASPQQQQDYQRSPVLHQNHSPSAQGHDSEHPTHPTLAAPRISPFSSSIPDPPMPSGASNAKDTAAPPLSPTEGMDSTSISQLASAAAANSSHADVD
ncbi:MAG: hypothetical protein M1831_005942 [Alyxoria varia]|nr:MAG: hypothetical protein M1831_005942 [Alyxoria varia]